MSPVDRDVARRKLARILASLRRMREAGEKGLEEYLASEDLQSIVERQLELAIGAAIDLNVHVLVQSGFGAPADAFNSFLDVATHTGALSMELARRLAPAAGLRNRLAHGYDDIDPVKVHSSLREALVVLPEYVAAMETFLSKAEGGR